MVYPVAWKCSVCGSNVNNSLKCLVCGYTPPAESVSLKTQSLSQGSLLKERILAFLIDLGFILIIALMIGDGIGIGFSVSFGEDISVLLPMFTLFSLVLGLILHPVYFILLEARYSSTYGKKIMKIIVRSDEGDIGLRKSIVRNGLRFIEAATLYIVSIIMIRQNGLRLGDRFAKTYVVKKSSITK